LKKTRNQKKTQPWNRCDWADGFEWREMSLQAERTICSRRNDLIERLAKTSEIKLTTMMMQIRWMTYFGL
jgi:hypothetical protein